jgi:hypothetical protein
MKLLSLSTLSRGESRVIVSGSGSSLKNMLPVIDITLKAPFDLFSSVR